MGDIGFDKPKLSKTYLRKLLWRNTQSATLHKNWIFSSIENPILLSSSSLPLLPCFSPNFSSEFRFHKENFYRFVVDLIGKDVGIIDVIRDMWALKINVFSVKNIAISIYIWRWKFQTEVFINLIQIMSTQCSLTTSSRDFWIWFSSKYIQSLPRELRS